MRIKTSIRTRVEGIKDQKKTISFFTSDQMSDEAATNDSEDETLSGQSIDGNIEETNRQDPANKVLSGDFSWMHQWKRVLNFKRSLLRPHSN